MSQPLGDESFNPVPVIHERLNAEIAVLTSNTGPSTSLTGEAGNSGRKRCCEYF